MKAICNYEAKVNIHIELDLEKMGMSFEQFKQMVEGEFESQFKALIKNEIDFEDEISTSVERINCTYETEE